MFDPSDIAQSAQEIEKYRQKPQLQNDPITDLRDGGTLSRSLPGYRERPAQIEMAQLVQEALLEQRQVICEAGTGTGKSLAYLIPVIRSGKKAIVSTANKALQEQLYRKDVPFCQQFLQPFEAALLKGKSNYLCLERYDSERNEGLQVHLKDPCFDRIQEALATDFNGDFETLPFTVSAEIRSRINVHEDECARRKCPSYAQCYYYRAREQAKQAQIVITNHDLLLLDAATHNKLLPPHDVVVVDEAHTLEGIAMNQFSIEVRPGQITSLLALQRVKNYTEEKTRELAEEQAQRLWLLLEELLDTQSRVALTEPVPLGLLLGKTIARLSHQLSAQRPYHETEQDEELYSRTIKRADNLADDLQEIFAVKQKDYVYYLERVQDRVIATMAPLDVSKQLRDTLFNQNPTVICCSATLSSPTSDGTPGFHFYQEQTGMDQPDILQRILPLVFDYQKHAILYLPQDLPDPTFGKTAEALHYEQSLASRMKQLVEASQGRAFLLFSSRRMLNVTAEQIGPTLETEGYTVLRQGDLPTTELMKHFKKSQKPVLLGLKTFWEGVDIPGEVLSLVVIDKIPFNPMDDPVVSAKINYIKQQGKNAFLTYSVPSITIALKQAVGRLIRTHTDTGVIAILDTRLQTKPYGRTILKCLPPARRSRNLEDVQAFFSPMGKEIQDLRTVGEILTKKRIRPTQLLPPNEQSSDSRYNAENHQQ